MDRFLRKDFWWNRFVYELKRNNFSSFDEAIENTTNWVLGYLKKMYSDIDIKQLRQKIKKHIINTILEEIERKIEREKEIETHMCTNCDEVDLQGLKELKEDIEKGNLISFDELMKKLRDE